MNTGTALTTQEVANRYQAVDGLVEDIWRYSEHLFIDASNCNVGKDPCTTGKKFNLVNVPVTRGDLDIVGKAVRDISFPV